MKTTKNYVGTKIGKFEILEQDYKNKTLYLKTKCTLCGKIAWVAQKHITTRKCCEGISSTQFKSLDLSGQTINGIEILEKTDIKKRNAYLWKCKCHCGNIFYAECYRIKNGEISSCGCKRRVYRENNFKQARKVLSSNYKDGTCIALIKNNKFRKIQGRLVLPNLPLFNPILLLQAICKILFCNLNFYLLDILPLLCR